jgi:leader peptidase (prepilin peptidase)/N-methyltransferase
VIAFVLFVFGAVVGSFANVCIARIPARESVVAPRSRCPRCRQTIAWYDNIPLVSWFVLRGRCRWCGEGISFRYVLIELAVAVAAVALYLRLGFGFEWLVAFGFVTTLLVVTVIDLDHRIIPDAISLPGIAAGFVLSLRGVPGPLSSGLGILLGTGLLLGVAWAYEIWTGREGMGGGDVKLLGMIGAFLGWPSVPFTLLVSSLAGSIVGIALMWWTGSDSKYAIPFGPFLSLGAVLYVFCGEEALGWYLGLGRP